MKKFILQDDKKATHFFMGFVNVPFFGSNPTFGDRKHAKELTEKEAQSLAQELGGKIIEVNPKATRK